MTQRLKATQAGGKTAVLSKTGYLSARYLIADRSPRESAILNYMGSI
jgi:hypothetical protein